MSALGRLATLEQVISTKLIQRSLNGQKRAFFVFPSIKPIYKKSVAKWKRYEPYIAELFDRLEPL